MSWKVRASNEWILIHNYNILPQDFRDIYRPWRKGACKFLYMDPFASFICGHTQSPILSLLWRPTSLTLSFISTLLLSFLTYSNLVPLESLCWPSTFTSTSHLLPLTYSTSTCPVTFPPLLLSLTLGLTL